MKYKFYRYLVRIGVTWWNTTFIGVINHPELTLVFTFIQLVRQHGTVGGHIDSFVLKTEFHFKLLYSGAPLSEFSLNLITPYLHECLGTDYNISISWNRCLEGPLNVQYIITKNKICNIIYLLYGSYKWCLLHRFVCL